jgi:hypothetical protein
MKSPCVVRHASQSGEREPGPSRPLGERSKFLVAMDSSTDSALQHAASSGVNEAVKALMTVIAVTACAYGLFAAPLALEKGVAALGLVFAPFWLATSRNRSVCRAAFVILAVACYAILFWVSVRLMPLFVHH